MSDIYKYPRTPHLEGSGILRGDEDLQVASLRVLIGRHLVIEEKMDGANSAISFDVNGKLFLQSRGHYLVGGPREAQFHLFKTWAHRYTMELWEALTDRYVMYGEWLYAKHTIFYTDLPHYFLEFDIYDKTTDSFLSTPQRALLRDNMPFVVPVKVLYEGQVDSIQSPGSLIARSHFINDHHLACLRTICQQKGLDVSRVLQETDSSSLMEGLYIKVEEEGTVKERYKYVRASFLQTVFDSESHWMDRPLLPNQLKAGISLF